MMHLCDCQAAAADATYTCKPVSCTAIGALIFWHGGHALIASDYEWVAGSMHAPSGIEPSALCSAVLSSVHCLSPVLGQNFLNTSS
jgi:hypothetical protein